MNPDPPNDPWNDPAPPPIEQPELISAAQPEVHPAPNGPPPVTMLSQVRLVIAWACIGICTLVLVGLQAVGMQAMEEQYADDPRPGFTALYMARYATGVEQLFPGQARALMYEFDDVVAATPFPVQSQSRSVILAGEVDESRLDDRTEELRRRSQLSAGSAEADADAQLILKIYEAGYTPTPSERDGLIERHGWFGEIAASYNLSETDQAYRSPRNSAKMVVIGLVAMLVVAGFAALVGCVLAVFAIVFLSLGKIRGSLDCGPTTHRTAYLEVAALFLACFIGLQVVLGIAEVVTGVTMMPAILVLSALPLLWPLVAGVRWRQYKKDMGYHTGKGLFREIGAGFVGYLAGLPIIAVGMLFMIVFSVVSGGKADHPMQYEMMDGGAVGPWILLFAAVVWAPLVEESVFRSAFHRHMRQRRGFAGFAIASVVTGFVFAAIHPQGWIAIPTLMCIAFVMTYLREWRNSIIASMVAHAMHNATISLLMAIILFA